MAGAGERQRRIEEAGSAGLQNVDRARVDGGMSTFCGVEA
jgi:hypothetical protein